MKKIILMVLCLVFIISLVSANEYEISPSELNWIDGRSYCQSLGNGWDLVSIETEAEQEIVYALAFADGYDYAWMSGRATSANIWKWQATDVQFYDGTNCLQDYCNWGPSEPNVEIGVTAMCVKAYAGGQCNALGQWVEGAIGSTNKKAICERLPPDNIDLQILPEGIIFSDEQPLRNTTITITALFENLLEEHPELITVNFYLDEINEENLIGTDVIENFRGDSYFAQIDWTAEEGLHNIIVFLDPYDNLYEFNETNNIASRELLVIPPFNIKLGDEDVGLTNYNPEAGHQINMLAMLHNLENIATDTFSVTFLLDNTEIIAEIETSLEALQTKTLTPLFTAVEGFHEIYIYADYYNEIEESNETNNLGITSFTGTGQIHCTDGTLFGECSNSPLYCDEGILINDCSTCGCPRNQFCMGSGRCRGRFLELSPILPP